MSTLCVCAVLADLRDHRNSLQFSFCALYKARTVVPKQLYRTLRNNQEKKIVQLAVVENFKYFFLLLFFVSYFILFYWI